MRFVIHRYDNTMVASSISRREYDGLVYALLFMEQLLPHSRTRRILRQLREYRTEDDALGTILINPMELDNVITALVMLTRTYVENIDECTQEAFNTYVYNRGGAEFLHYRLAPIVKNIGGIGIIGGERYEKDRRKKGIMRSS